jgi:hypothetical protein
MADRRDIGLLAHRFKRIIGVGRGDGNRNAMAVALMLKPVAEEYMG